MAKENSLFDNDILVDDEGNVIEENITDEKKSKTSTLEEGQFLINEQGLLLDSDGNPIENTNGDSNDNSDDEPLNNKSGNTGEPASTNSNTNSTLPPFAESLKEAGILPDLEIEEGVDITAETLVEAVRNQIKKSEFSDLSEEQKEILQVIRTGGDVKKYLEYYDKEVTAKTEFKELTEDNAEEFTKQYYKMKGLSDEEIVDIIDERTINGTMLDKASKLKDSYNLTLETQRKKQVELSKEQELKSKQEIEQDINKYKETINSTDELIKGIKITQSVKDKIFELGTKPVENKNGESLTALQKAYQEDPHGTEFKLNYLYLITDGFKKMDNLSSSKNSKSKAIQELNDKLEQEKHLTNGMKTSKTNKNNNNPSILDAKF